MKKILFVTHSGVIRSLLSEAKKINLDEIFNVSVEYDEIFRFKVNYSDKPCLNFLDKKEVFENKQNI